MNFYTVHEPPDAPIDRVDRAGSLTFVGDRFSPTAVVLGPLWLAANRVWYGLAIYLAVMLAVVAITVGARLNPGWLVLTACAMNLIVGFEAPSLKRWALERRGWQPLGTVSGRSLDECERRFLESWLPEQRLVRRDADTSRGVNFTEAPADIAEGPVALEAGRRRGWLRWLLRRR